VKLYALNTSPKRYNTEAWIKADWEGEG